MWKKSLILIVLSIFLPSYLISQNAIGFYEEHIDFNLNKEHFFINGIYSFCNNSKESANQHIIFPFAVKSSLVDSIGIIDLRSLKVIKYIVLDNAISFDLSIPPNDSLDINIRYRQKSSDLNRYIITTTQLWDKPLDKAVYTLTSPKELTIISFSYSPDSIKLIEDDKIYYWNESGFSPQFDFDIVVNNKK